MKVLHLPVNIGSQMSITVRGLREIGVDARGLVRNNTLFQDAEGMETFVLESLTKHPIRGRVQRLSWWRAVLKAIRWADVIHWHFRSRALPASLDLKYIVHLNKPRVVEFWGTDIRIPEIASADNPYIAEMYAKDPAKAEKVAKRSRKVQERFARHGFRCIIPAAEMEPYVFDDLFPQTYKSVARIIVSDFDPKYPDPQNERPVVMHYPSNKGYKGTEAIVAAVEQLKSEIDFEFRLVHGMERSQALKIVRECDVMIDEVISGDYGVAAMEAMALGKPTVGYIKPLVSSGRPPELPIVSATQESIRDVLKDLLTDGSRRHEIGRRSRAYVEKHHDAPKVAKDLVRIYEELIEETGRTNSGGGQGAEPS